MTFLVKTMKPLQTWNTKVLLSFLALLGIEASTARADYVLEITDGDATPQTASVLPGESITLLLVLSSPSEDQIDSFVLDVGFSAPGLFYQSYEFDETAFIAGNPGEDFSGPGLDDLPQPPSSPHIIMAASYVHTPSTPGDVDIHFEAVSTLDAQGAVLTFGSGVLARIHLSVPLDFNISEVVITPISDTFALGSDIINAESGASFRLTVTGVTAPGDTPGSGGGSGGTGGSDPEPPPDDGGDIPGDDPDDDGGDAGGGTADDDSDGIANDVDLCPATLPGTVVDETGCTTTPAPSPPTAMDQDQDGVVDDADLCPNTPADVVVDDDGCELGGESSGADNPTPSLPGVCGAMGLLSLSWVVTTLVGLRRPRRRLRRSAPGLPQQVLFGL